MLVGALSWVIAFLGTLLPDVRSLPSPWAVLIPPTVALAVSLALAFVQAAIPTSAGPAGPARREPARSRGLPMLAAVIAIVVVLGLGGLAVSWGARAVAQVAGFSLGPVPGLPNTFDKQAEERLTKTRSGSAGDLKVTVRSVKQGERDVRAEVVVVNSGDRSIDLPLFGYCILSSADGVTLEADSFGSQWSTAVAAGGTSSGVILFSGVLPTEETQASLSFTTVFGRGAGPEGLTVKDLRLAAI